MTENERLTHSRMSGIFGGYWTAASKTELLNRLAEYENTGLAPDQVRALANNAYLDQQRSALADRLCRWLANCANVTEGSSCARCDYQTWCDSPDTNMVSAVMMPLDAVEDLRKYLDGGDDDRA